MSVFKGNYYYTKVLGKRSGPTSSGTLVPGSSKVPVLPPIQPDWDPPGYDPISMDNYWRSHVANGPTNLVSSDNGMNFDMSMPTAPWSGSDYYRGGYVPPSNTWTEPVRRPSTGGGGFFPNPISLPSRGGGSSAFIDAVLNPSWPDWITAPWTGVTPGRGDSIWLEPKH